MTDTLARARSAVDKPVTYKLGQPGRVIPPKATTAPLPKLCDCSGFAFWCLNRERFTKKRNGIEVWFDTSGIHGDARLTQMFFEPCAPESGCLIVWPDGNGKEGHVGIVSEVVDGKVARVIHCAASHPKGRAVQETGPEVFERNNAICCRWREA